MTSRTMGSPVRSRILWAPVSSDLTVGNADGSYVGSIDRSRDGFVAVDGRGQYLGRFASLDEAKAELARRVRADRRRVHPPAPLKERAAVVSATVAGAVAIGLAITAGAFTAW